MGNVFHNLYIFGKKLLETLGDSSIDISQLQLGNESSGMSVAIVDKLGNYGAVIVSAANLKIDKDRFSINKDTGILLLQNEISDEINTVASQRAKEIGSEVWLNAAPSRKISPQLLSHVDVLIMNSIEAKFYREDLESSQANHLTKILTLGSKGLEIYLPGKPKKKFPAYSVKVLSTHGAGDTFIGSLAAKRLEGETFEIALKKLCLNLAKQIVVDGEGAKKFVTINVINAKSLGSAKNIAFSIANSPLVKTAAAGEDPNWGRIVMGIGKSGEIVDQKKLKIKIGNYIVAENGKISESYNEKKLKEYMEWNSIELEINLKLGSDAFKCYTCDFTHDYIDINADYRN